MDTKTFCIGMRTLTGALPYGKKLNDEELGFLWLTLEQEERDLPDEVWAKAIKARLKEPGDGIPDNMPVHKQVFRHCFCNENGWPNVKWGRKLFTAEEQKVLEAAHEQREANWVLNRRIAEQQLPEAS